MLRTIQPELLDSLPPDHPDALHNRRDLLAINTLMGNHRWFERTLPPILRPSERVLEIGAGTGELCARLARAGVAIDGLDVCPQPAEWPDGRSWHRIDLRSFDGYHRYAVIIGNLIFHQFSAEGLGDIGKKLSVVRLVLACEPARRRMSQALLRPLGKLLRFSHVTQHDAHVTVAAGFRANELSVSLGLDPRIWNVRRETSIIGAHRVVMIRR